MSVDLERVEQPYQSPADATPQQPEHYRALSSAAVAAFIFGLLSLTALLDTWLVVVPAVGIVWGFIALRQIRARPDELSGGALATCGLTLSCVLLFAGPAWVYYSEASQVPPGHLWIDYDFLQPNTKVIGEVVPQSAVDLNGQKVFIKGYVYAGSQSEGIKQFVLVRDAGTCCFGGNPKLTDRIVVNLATQGGMVYTKQIVRVAGTFRVAAGQAPGLNAGAYYFIDRAELR